MSVAKMKIWLMKMAANLGKLRKSSAENVSACENGVFGL